MNLTVIGTGYVGLVAGTCFAETGNDVVCVDIDEEKIAMLKSGKVPIYEPGLEEIVRRNAEDQRLSFTNELGSAVKKSEIIFIAVGTPQSATGHANLSYVEATARSIGKAMNGFKIIVTKSTVPVGTADLIKGWLSEETRQPFAVASNPEFMKEGAAVEDFMKPDRVVLGGDNPEALETLKELYEPFLRTGNPILVMDSRSAEMSKYAANAMLATKISFINEIACLCEELRADVSEVRRAISLDRRIGPHFIFPGVGYGGSCFPKDIRAMISMAGDNRAMPLLTAVEQVNERQKGRLFDKVKNHFGDDLSRLTFAIWGLAFKPRTDDMRDAPSIVVIKALLDAGSRVQAFDPEAMEEARKIFGDRIQYTHRNYDALHGAAALLILTEWNEFRRPDFARIKSLLKQPVIFDGRNIFDPADLRKLGFTYYSIGRNDG
ncbi:MAG TPA: UDP-glucose/GDP-mannose dehydrogenase family protein [Candidatus Eisenbacteria bacterium]|jgi:UDPglucose 6-dehydrogenase|nr:UDP-glucose/GDP-mannose dehydrogenase family protein [Candidatus Eisenbacteria bacterium]